MKILITGSRGFLGQQVVKQLTEHEIVHWDRSYNLTKIIDVDRFFHEKNLHDLDCVIHLAANCGGIEYNQNHAYDLIKDNLEMNMNLINVCRTYKPKKFVFCHTTCGYPRIPETIPFIEDELFDGLPEPTNLGYAASKFIGHLLLENSGLEYVVAVPTNLAGSNDHFNEKAHIIPKAIMKIGKAKKDNSDAVFLGSPEITRDIISTEDAARGIKMLLESNLKYKVYNIGSGNEYEIGDIVGRISKKMNYDGMIIWKNSLPGQPRRSLNIDRIKSLGFCPTKSLDDIIDSELSTYYAL